ncbi:hypothetical protein [Paraliomyxa miuraensis]|uniref:hypothetical protein n=1 Tax=Paraliomyxa miuraensis TaxID=376150 RepID=UPI002256BDFC|nr:hypothetical protein [Paraliomyxa miuraensis]MCX4242509.1 hypothetical protein [Paraliomyxa miuraensis]
MTIEVGTDPQQPVPLTCIINSSGDLEVKYGSDSLTHPEVQDLVVGIDDADDVTFQTADFYAGSVHHSVAATMVGGSTWDDGGTTIVSSALPGDQAPGQLHEVDVSATNTSTNQTQTVRIRIRIREEIIRPLPSP